ncbi:hypothetical protein DM01DRAFT_330929 [Hesseltinella vesiculosa]|uniref:Uncharacterized protein n=1 Tax=Hesseltinella vesiculosa TaxID=101127 RepID=A0A1X2G201_9FUNG|nr:hypothetical protein DM01DRAFT_330929 [Hesseltinella vesiculosa]
MSNYRFKTNIPRPNPLKCIGCHHPCQQRAYATSLSTGMLDSARSTSPPPPALTFLSIHHSAEGRLTTYHRDRHYPGQPCQHNYDVPFPPPPVPYYHRHHRQRRRRGGN